MDIGYLALATVALRQHKVDDLEKQNPLDTREMALAKSKRENPLKRAVRNAATLASGLKNRLSRQNEQVEAPTGAPAGATTTGEHRQVSMS